MRREDFEVNGFITDTLKEKKNKKSFNPPPKKESSLQENLISSAFFFGGIEIGTNLPCYFQKFFRFLLQFPP